MALKRECDRCGKQWEPKNSVFDEEYAADDTQLGIVIVTIPSDHRNHTSVSKQYDLCQKCARLVNEACQKITRGESTNDIR